MTAPEHICWWEGGGWTEATVSMEIAWRIAVLTRESILVSISLRRRKRTLFLSMSRKERQRMTWLSGEEPMWSASLMTGRASEPGTGASTRLPLRCSAIQLREEVSVYEC